MTFIYIDEKKYKVNESDNLLVSFLNSGLDIPYFCWHPELGSIGACRQCAVKLYGDNQQEKLIMSCMTPSTNGIKVSILDKEAQKFRKQVLECLLINHPHDCPVCEEGGNCHLQDMTVMVGKNSRRYFFTKRVHESQYLGPFISHEMNRCIVCYRCIRYYRDYAGGKDLGAYGLRDNIYFGRINDGLLENEFSGNLIEICPTGVFVDKTHSSHYTRKWDMQFSPSICQQCSIGCNILIGERNGKIRKIENRYNGNINHYFLCDRGRFGYEYLNLKDRPKNPKIRHNGIWKNLNFYESIEIIVKLLKKTKKTIGIGSPRSSVENNFALQSLVGYQNFFSGVDEKEQIKLITILDILQNSGIYTPSLREIEDYDAILILGEDITQTGPRMALAVRQAVRKSCIKKSNFFHWQSEIQKSISHEFKYPLFIFSSFSTRLDDIALWNYHASPDDQSRLGFVIANLIDKSAPKVSNIDSFLVEKANSIANFLMQVEKPLIISGSNVGNLQIIQSAANIAYALKLRGKSKVGISFVTLDVNSIGLVMIGGKKSLNNALERIRHDKIDNLIVLENDLYRHEISKNLDPFLSKVENIIVFDHQNTPFVKKMANFLFSVKSFAESTGTVINQEGRAQKFFQTYDLSHYEKNSILLESWRWIHTIHSKLSNKEIQWKCVDYVLDEVILKYPKLKKLKEVSLDSNYRVHGQKFARLPHRYTGRSSTFSHINVHEQKVPEDIDSMFTFSTEGSHNFSLCKQIPFSWHPGWNSPQSWNKLQKNISGHLLFGDPGKKVIKTEINSNYFSYYKKIPKKFRKISNLDWLVVPFWKIFGSEETSQLSPTVQKILPSPYIIMNKLDAKELEIQKNSFVYLLFKEKFQLYLPVKLNNVLQRGLVGLPLGFSGIPLSLSGSVVSVYKEICSLS